MRSETLSLSGRDHCWFMRSTREKRPVVRMMIMMMMMIIIKIRMKKYMDDENLIPKEQNGCCRGSKGCKDQLLI